MEAPWYRYESWRSIWWELLKSPSALVLTVMGLLGNLDWIGEHLPRPTDLSPILLGINPLSWMAFFFILATIAIARRAHTILRQAFPRVVRLCIKELRERKVGDETAADVWVRNCDALNKGMVNADLPTEIRQLGEFLLDLELIESKPYANLAGTYSSPLGRLVKKELKRLGVG